MLPSWIRSRNGHAAADVLLGHADDQAGVGLDQVLLGGLAVLDGQEQAIPLVRIVDAQGQLLPRIAPALHPLRQRDLFLSRQQRNPADLLEIQADGIVDVDQVQINIQLGNLRARIFAGVLSLLLLAKVPDLDALLEQVREQVFELLHVGFSFGKRIQDIIVGHEPLIAPRITNCSVASDERWASRLLLIFFRQEFLVF